MRAHRISPAGPCVQRQRRTFGQPARSLRAASGKGRRIGRHGPSATVATRVMEGPDRQRTEDA
ncbi:hypothetical protein LF41_49 [Lysobacter dokdonensis DS-58]|uniref:Uncharacterized protein n=1 Tax=Lysobacter dokdonensis DS-58 TaxID=1300345 RepID=A0A0A2WQ07_9GAMM|nr:hypothetical protein LF41_49 [Lysobacter dokdonensis DS-58]